MLTDRYDPVDLFAAIPQLSLRMEPELAQLDRLLEDDAILQEVKADLGKRYPQTLVRGRHSTPVEVILRMLIVKRLYGFSYEQTEYFVSDSLTLRQFCRLGFHRVPDDTTLIRWVNQIEPATVERINDRVVALARSLKVTRGRKLRVDSTLTETNIHYPTDASLLGDVVRVLSRLLRRAKRETPVGAAVGEATFTSHERSARKWTQAIYRLVRRVRKEQGTAPGARGTGKGAGGAGDGRPAAPANGNTPPQRKPATGRPQTGAGTAPGAQEAGGASPATRKPQPVGSERASAPAPASATPGSGTAAGERRSAQERMKEAYGHLIAVARQSVDQARRVQDALGTPEAGVAAKLAQQLDTFVPRAEGILAQAQRRVLLGETVPAPEKRVSLFEPQTQIVNRGKPSRPVEFGRKVQFEEVEGGIVSGYRVQAEPGSDAPYLKASLEKHRALFGKAPDLLSTDRGYYSPANVQLAQEAGVKRVVIPVAGKATVAQKQQEKERWFRRGYRFRAGSEGRISVLKRRFGLRRCLDHGEPGFERWVGMGVVTSNLLQIARATVGS